MKIISFFICATSLVLFLKYFCDKKNFLLDKKNQPHKCFASNNLVPLIGGFIIIPSLFFFHSKVYLIFYISIFTLGIFSDLNLITSPLKKIIVQTLTVALFLIFSKLSILSTKIFFIDFLINNSFFAIFFTLFCILIVINGSNFLDGINTLVNGYYMCVILIIYYLVIYHKINYNLIFFNYLICSLLIIFIFNFFSKLYLGDSGVFLLGFIISVELILLSNSNLSSNKYISPIFIVLLLWYPAFENLFSIIRKTLNHIGPGNPDNKHLHQLIFLLVKKKITNKIFSNSITGVIINFYNAAVFLIGIKFISNSTYLSFLLIFNVLVYILCYYSCQKIIYGKNNSNSLHKL